METAKKLQEKEFYTYEDYLSWGEDFRCEIIDGVIYAMTPPLTIHQRILTRLLTKFYNFLEGKKCEVFPAPFGVRLHLPGERDTIVEPDIVVVCDESKIDEKGCNGSPDLLVEIISPSDPSRDTFEKYQKYLKAKVKEYWIVDPKNKYINFCVLDGDTYVSKIYTQNETIESSVIKGLKVNLSDVFK